MYSRLRLAEKYLRYYLTAANGRGHGVHSPFVYSLVREVLMDRMVYPEYAVIEGLRRRLLKDRSVLEVLDMGAGSALDGGVGEGIETGAGMAAVGTRVGAALRTRRVRDIARYAAKPARLGQLLFRLARLYRPSVMVELGTSLGLSTAYLAAGNPRGRVWTMEGSPAVADRARRNLTELGFPRVEVMTGNFDVLLGPLVELHGPLELAFVDGNHRFEPTMRYFDLLFRHSGRSSMLIFDDIHWSADMERAWTAIKADPRVRLTIDLFFFGLVVRRDEFKVKQDFTIQF